MISNNPLLRPVCRRHGIHDGLFDPVSLLVYLPQERIGNVDVVSTRLAQLHEHLHWFQHVGTSVGAFLSMTQFALQQFTINWFSSLDEEERQRAVRRRQDGRPLVEVDSTGRLVNEADEWTEFYRIQQQIWYDGLVLLRLFEDSSVFLDSRPPEDQIGDAISDTYLYCVDRLSLDVPADIFAVREQFRPEGTLVFPATGDVQVTTTGLFESHATAVELQVLRSVARVLGERYSLLLRNRVTEFLDGKRGAAFTIFRHITGAHVSVGTLLDTFIVICDAALNPPLPPYNDRSEIRRWRWLELYPPLRFIALCYAAEQVGMLVDKGADDYGKRVLEYVDALSEVANLPPWTLMRHWADDQDSIIFDLGALESQLPDVTEDSLFSIDMDANYSKYLLAVQQGCWRKRSEDPLLMIDHGAASRRMAHPVDVIAALTMPGGLWLGPPLLCPEPNRLQYSVRLSSKIGTWLVLSSAVMRAMYDVVCGTGPIDLTAYPTESIVGRSEGASIRNSVMRSLKIDLGCVVS